MEKNGHNLFTERICALCEGAGCWFCNHTGAVQVKVTITEFYQQ